MNDFAGELIEKHLNGALKSEETARLGRMLVENPALADRFVEAVRMDTGLRQAMKEQEREPLFVRLLENVQKNLPPPGRRKRVRAAVEKRAAAVLVLWRPLTAAAAGLAVLGGGAWLAFHPRDTGVAEQGQFAGATPKVDRKVFTGSGASGFMDAAPEKMDAAAVKRRLRGFFVPSVGVRNVPVSEALAALEEQWKSLPHRRGPESAAEVAFVIAESVRKLWTDEADEPRVTLEMPGVSLLTHLELLAAQAGLKAGVSEKGVMLEWDTRASAEDPNEVKTWTLPVAKETLAALTRQISRFPVDQNAMPVRWLYKTKDGGLIKLGPSGASITLSGKGPSEDNPITGRVASWTDDGNQVTPDTDTDRILNPADRGTPPAYGEQTLTAQQEMENQTAALAANLEVLNNLSGDELIDAVAKLGVRDSTIDVFYDIYNNDKAEYENLTGSGYGQRHPRLVGLKKALETTRAALETAATQYRKTLQLNIDNLGSTLQEIDMLSPARVLMPLIGAYGGAEAAYNEQTEILTLMGNQTALRSAQKAVAALEESLFAGAALEIRFLEWDDAPPAEVSREGEESGLLSDREFALLWSRQMQHWSQNGVPLCLARTEEIYTGGEGAVSTGRTSPLHGEGHVVMRQFSLHRSSIPLRRSYRQKPGDHEESNDLEVVLGSGRNGELFTVDFVSTLNAGRDFQDPGDASGMTRAEMKTSLSAGQWAWCNLKGGGGDEKFGVTVFLRAKPVVLR